MRHHLLLALLQGTSRQLLPRPLLPRCASQHHHLSPDYRLGSCPAPARALCTTPHVAARMALLKCWSVRVPLLLAALRGCLSLQHPPKSFPQALLLSFLTSGLASMAPRLHHGGLLATQEHALRATAWGPRPHCTEHASPRCPIDQRRPSLTTRQKEPPHSLLPSPPQHLLPLRNAHCHLTTYVKQFIVHCPSGEGKLHRAGLCLFCSLLYLAVC